jgi:hypothetical protein
MQGSTAQDARAAANQAPFPEDRGRDQRVGPDVDVPLDDNGAMRENEAEPEKAIAGAAVEREPIEPSPQDHAGQPGKERHRLRTRVEDALTRRREAALERAAPAERRHERDADGIERHLHRAVQEEACVHAAPAASSRAARRLRLKRVVWSGSDETITRVGTL